MYIKIVIYLRIYLGVARLIHAHPCSTAHENYQCLKEEVFLSMVFEFCGCHAKKYKNANNCWYLGICEHDTFHAQSG